MLVSYIMRFFIVLLFSFTMMYCCLDSKGQHSIKWIDDFTKPEKELLAEYAKILEKAADKVLGNYPFSVQLYFHKKRSNSSPIPWAYTERDDFTQSIHLHVDTRYDLDEFLNDWTMPHEWSHLAIPFVGDKNRWFSEGFASFMQWQILHEMGQMDDTELKNKTKEKCEFITKYFESDRTVFESVIRYQNLRNYPAWYYGGASYFYVVNNVLTEDNKSLSEIIKLYQQNGNRRQDLKELVVLFDELSSSSVFSKVLEAYYELNGADFVKMLKQKTQN